MMAPAPSDRRRTVACRYRLITQTTGQHTDEQNRTRVHGCGVGARLTGCPTGPMNRAPGLCKQRVARFTVTAPGQE
jgi:hypothetical protein